MGFYNKIVAHFAAKHTCKNMSLLILAFVQGLRIFIYGKELYLLCDKYLVHAV